MILTSFSGIGVAVELRSTQDEPRIVVK